jgi:sulfate permease, SulP family
VAAYLAPQVMAYATVADVPPVVGLWALLPPLVCYAVLGSSRQLSAGPESSTALMTAAVLAPMAAGGPGHYAALAAALAVLVGAICFLAGVARPGFLANPLSRPVPVGYMAGIAIVLIGSQLGKITDVPAVGEQLVNQIRSLGTRIHDIHWPTVALSGSVLALLGFVSGVAGMHDVDDYPEARPVPGLVVYRYDAPLRFANAEDFRTRALAAIEPTPCPSSGSCSTPKPTWKWT